MKRIVCLLLVVVLLFSAAAFSACRKKTESAFETTDWQNYVVVYNAGGVALLKDAVGELTRRIASRTGVDPTRESTDEGGDVETDDFEIVIGATDRAVTKTAKGRVSGNGWCILPTGKKIVVYGTTELLTLKAVQAFIDAYLPAGGTDTAPADLKEDVRSDVPMVEISAEQSLVYAAGLDSEKGCAYGTDYYTTKENPDAYDYPVVAARQMRETMAEISGCQDSDLALRKDSSTPREREVVVGVTSRQITKDLLAELGNVHRYGILIRDGSIAVAGFNDVTLRLAVTLFNNCLNSAEKTEEGRVLLPDDLLLVKAKATDNWITDFPLPDYEGLTLSASEDVGQNSVEYLYTGSGVTTANYEDYCATLTENGYELYTGNTIEGSVYRTYYNKEKEVMLHVTYAAFAHAAEQKVTRFKQAIRIVSSPTGINPLTKARLIEKEALNPVQTFEKITDTRITAMQFNRAEGNWGNAYIITLEDGSFIVLDGGSFKGATQDHMRLFYVLRDLYYLAHGYAPDNDEHRIKLAAWYLSHSHGDHANNFVQFASTYGKRVDAERMIANLASDSEGYNSYDPNHSTRDNIQTILGYFNTRMAYYKVRTGWKFYIRNVEFEVLYTHEDLVPERVDLFNETSTVIRMTIYNTDGQGNRRGTPTTALWLGDLHTKGSQFLRATYGHYLKSDMGQVAHHGYIGCEWEFYQLVAPKCLWWPGAWSEAAGWQTSGASSARERVVDHHLYYDLTSVEYIIVNDLKNVTVTITEEGPQYGLDKLYNAAENETDPITAYGSRTVKSPVIKLR